MDVSAGAESTADMGAVQPVVQSGASGADMFESVSDDAAAGVDSSTRSEEKQTFKQFLLKRHNIAGRAVPMFAIILAALIATATVATAAFLIYRSVAVGQVQEEQVQEVPVKKKKKVVRKRKEVEEEPEETNDHATKNRRVKRAERLDRAKVEDSEGQDAQDRQQVQAETEVEEPEGPSEGGEVTTPVESSYDPVAEVGSWTGTLQQFGYKYDAAKTGSYKEGSGGCGICYGAQNHPLKMNITSVDAASRTASGTVSFLMHGHNGPLDVDENSDAGDAYVENVPFTSISIDGWRSGNAINLYTGHGKTVQMTLRLKYGSSDDYSVWIRTVPSQFQAGKYNLTYTWGQTDMYTITKN